MGLAGAWADAGQDVRANVLRMLERTRQQPGTGPTLNTAGDVTMGVTGEASLSPGSVSVAFTGTLFERQALRDRLQGPSGEASDAALVAAAYERWGLDSPRELDGEFAFVLWDARRRRLMLGRDAMGRGCLHYARAGSSLVFATTPEALFGWPGLIPTLDETHLARIMTLQFVAGETMFAGIRAPAPGHIVILEADKPERSVRFWYPERAPALRVKDPREYAEALYAAMERAVALRLPETGLVVSELSSGYDSSAVTALAAKALAAQNRPLLAVTSVPAHQVDASAVIPNGYSNEWDLAALVARRYPNIEHVAVRTDAAPWFESLDAMTQVLGAPPLFIRNMPWMYAARRMAQERGAAVMLTGQNGNLSGSYDGGFALFDSLRRGDLLRLLRTGAAWRRTGTGWASLLMRTWMPTPATRARMRRVRGRAAERAFADHSVLRPEFLQNAGVAIPGSSLIGLPVEGDRTNGASRRLSVMRMIDFGIQYEEERQVFGYRRTDPTADRRLVELCLAIPDWAYCPGGRRRELYRQAMGRVLPAEILNEHGLGLQASDFLENFAEGMPEWNAELQRLEHSDADRYLDLPRLQTLLNDFTTHVAADRAEADVLYNYTVGGAIVLGRFLRRLHDGTLLPVSG